MGKSFDELMRLSDKGYIDRFDDIDGIIYSLMNTSPEELEACYGSRANLIAGNLLILNSLPDEYISKLKFCDLLNMTAHLGEIYDINKIYKYTELTGDMLLTAQNTIPKIKLFLAISIKSFTDFIDRKAGTNKCSKIYREIQDIAEVDLNLDITDTTTFGGLLNRLINLMTRMSIGHPVEEFVDRREYCNEIIKMLFIDCMRLGYKELFDYVKLEISLYQTACDKFDFENEFKFFGIWDEELDSIKTNDQ